MTFAGVASAAAPMGGLGFRVREGLDLGPVGFAASPTVGVRHWFSEQMAVDGAIGVTSFTIESNGTKVNESTGFSFDAGVPISLKSWDKVNFILRPGIIYATGTAKNPSVTTPPNELKASAFMFTAEFEVEWMVADNLAVSAAHGFGYSSLKIEDNDSPVNEAKISGFDTTGGSFTELGFHIYLW
jgi:hypothetical protein